MSLNIRLVELQKTLGFKTDGQFADFLDVNRSTLSYNLKGKTEPKYGLFVSLLEKVEELNPFWLILGKGEMFLADEDAPVSNSSEMTETTEPSVVKDGDVLRMQGKVELLKELLAEKEKVAELRNVENQNLLLRVGELEAKNKELKIRESELLSRLLMYGDEEAKKESNGA